MDMSILCLMILSKLLYAYRYEMKVMSLVLNMFRVIRMVTQESHL